MKNKYLSIKKYKEFFKIRLINYMFSLSDGQSASVCIINEFVFFFIFSFKINNHKLYFRVDIKGN
jgi:hypothetical protein